MSSSSLSPNNSSSSANKRVREQHHFSSDSHVKVEEGRLEDSVSCRVRAKRGCDTHPEALLKGSGELGSVTI
ncbi:hypothetical protein ACFX13_001179 [Malus domestica]